MPTAVTVQIPSAIGGIQILTAAEAAKKAASAAAETAAMTGLKARLESLTAGIQRASEEIEAFGQNLFVQHRQQVVHLAIEIAARILAKDISEGHYDIEKILADAIQQTSSGPVLEIRLHPDDIKTYEEQIKNGQSQLGSNIKLTSDWSIGRAECVVETAQGIVECKIQEHLKQIETALLTTSST